LRQKDLETLKASISRQAGGNQRTERDRLMPGDAAVITDAAGIAGAARFARRKGILAARALKAGQGDLGHLRDLADAALFGCPEAALALFEVTRTAKAENKAQQAIESFVWISLASVLDPSDRAASANAAVLEVELTSEQRRTARDIMNLLEERRSALLAHPFATVR
jgi:hypothetical protein